MRYLKTYIFNHFYQHYLVLLTMVPRIGVAGAGAGAGVDGAIVLGR